MNSKTKETDGEENGVGKIENESTSQSLVSNEISLFLQLGYPKNEAKERQKNKRENELFLGLVCQPLVCS